MTDLVPEEALVAARRAVGYVTEDWPAYDAATQVALGAAAPFIAAAALEEAADDCLTEARGLVKSYQTEHNWARHDFLHDKAHDIYNRANALRGTTKEETDR